VIHEDVKFELLRGFIKDKILEKILHITFDGEIDILDNSCENVPVNYTSDSSLTVQLNQMLPI
jgi:hypothetical protein